MLRGRVSVPKAVKTPHPSAGVRCLVPGGTLDYDGLAVQFGIRFTFGK